MEEEVPTTMETELHEICPPKDEIKMSRDYIRDTEAKPADDPFYTPQRKPQFPEHSEEDNVPQYSHPHREMSLDSMSSSQDYCRPMETEIIKAHEENEPMEAEMTEDETSCNNPLKRRLSEDSESEFSHTQINDRGKRHKAKLVLANLATSQAFEVDSIPNGTKTLKTLLHKEEVKGQFLPGDLKPDISYEEARIFAMETIAGSNHLSSPKNLQSALTGPDASEWKIALEKELSNLKGKYQVILPENSSKSIPKGTNLMTIKEVLTAKADPSQGIKRKVRFVGRGFAQREGIDFEDIAASVAGRGSLLTLIAIAAHRGYLLAGLDVRAAYLNSKLDIYQYTSAPSSFGYPKGTVLKWTHSLYGFKQSGAQWQKHLADTLSKIGIYPTTTSECIYNGLIDGKPILVATYVDDLIYAAPDRSTIQKFTDLMKEKYEVTTQETLSSIIGLEVDQDQEGIQVHQRDYIRRILSSLNIPSSDKSGPSTPLPPNTKLIQDDCPKTNDEKEKMKNIPYARVIGMLIYLSTWTRPDIVAAVSMLARFTSNPGRNHWNAVCHLLKYIAGTSKHALYFRREIDKPVIEGWSDSDWAGNNDTCRSRTGAIVTFNGTPITWRSFEQRSVADSTASAELQACRETMRHAISIRDLLIELNILNPPVEPITIYIDNQAVVKGSLQSAATGRLRHLNITRRGVHEAIQQGKIKLTYIRSENQLADALTKPANKNVFERFTSRIFRKIRNRN
jgi:hypothetical protein